MKDATIIEEFNALWFLRAFETTCRIDLSKDEKGHKHHHLLTIADHLCGNNSEDELTTYEDNPHYQKVVGMQIGALKSSPYVRKEAELAELEDEEREVFVKILGFMKAGDRLVRASYSLLGLATYFTAGVKEVRAWTFTRGMTAPECAGVIHTDFKKGYIRAETISYEDFIHYGGEQACKDAGKMRLEGKDYIVQDGDIMHFRFNV